MYPKKIYGLIGPPGSGKSFRAFLLADKYKIEFIIDDGLLIQGQHIIAGRSAKREQYHVAAVKRAIFHEPKHAREVRKQLYKLKFTSVLILATSENMLNKIVEKLHLSKPTKIIRIEDIATEDEIRLAQKSRLRYGKHVMPIPLMEVKKIYPNIALHAIHMFVNEPKGFFFKKNKKRLIEKTIVRPNFGNNGNISISETALLQMVNHCIAEYSNNIKLLKVSVIEKEEGFSLDLNISVEYSMNSPDTIKTIQKIVKDKIEQFTGIPIIKVNVQIVKSHYE
ncbi:MAG TPA: Asp23/Gls24 family envelope stress response protein [Spirochaetota bacterium]|nr:Asp23/Gls24 family envelope stress response protein [Spirochaetota bacterium]HOF01935.1 Asp23/Gls24 family envelope stress response protein [Spirochaetota bacterium]HOS31728.1 Asp23/Gls24 family envelope stress response protein [Spirochaetota bacterium]HOS54566.1 Asp23/Gls24 family envelope stress response protein [Spirochaetota bacterium]HPK61284.1 Asp23/Gls24 family envelope stress response protein [Spirochaetota bacterium]